MYALYFALMWILIVALILFVMIRHGVTSWPQAIVDFIGLSFGILLFTALGSMFVQRNFLDSSVQTVVQKSSLLVPLHPSGAFLEIKTNGKGVWVTTQTYRYQTSNDPTAMPQTITDDGDGGQNGMQKWSGLSEQHIRIYK